MSNKHVLPFPFLKPWNLIEIFQCLYCQDYSRKKEQYTDDDDDDDDDNDDDEYDDNLARWEASSCWLFLMRAE